MRSLSGMFATMAAVGLLSGCGGPLKYQVPGSAKAADSDAKIVADVREKEHMTKLEIHIEHLTPPARIENSTSYVVWARKGSSEQWSRVGVLAYDEGDRTGVLEGASVPLTAFDLEISAEKDDSAASPSSSIVVQQRVAE